MEKATIITLDTSCFSRNPEEHFLLNKLLELQENLRIILYYAPTTLQEISMYLAKKKNLSKEVEMKIKYVFRDIIRDYIENMEEINPNFELDDEFHKIATTITRLFNTDTKLVEKLISYDAIRKYLDKKKNVNRRKDIDIFTFHVMNKGHIFLTRDKRMFINNQKVKEKLENEFNTKIRYLDEKFLSEIF